MPNKEISLLASRWRISALVGAILLIVVVPFVLLQKSSSESLAAMDAVAHSHEVNAAINTLLVDLREAEVAGLSVALGAQAPTLLQRLGRARAVLGQGFEEVVRLTADNPRQQVRLGQIKEAIDRRLEMVERVAADRSGHAQALVDEMELRYLVRDQVGELLAIEQDLLRSRTANADRQRQTARWLAIAAMVLQLLLLGVVSALLLRQVKRSLEAENASQAANARAGAVMQTVREPIVLLDGAQKVLMHNAAFSELYGLADDVRNQSLDDIGDRAWQDPVIRQRLADVLGRDRELWDFEHEQRTADGIARTLLINARRMPLPDRDDAVVLMTLTDISNQKASQQRMLDLNRQLEGKMAQVSEVNQELEAFSYSVSHDLRAPLRHVAGFADKLRRHLGEGADDKSNHYLKVIGDSARRMSDLIDDLLVYSRLGRSALRLQAVDMQSLVEETRSMLESTVGETPGRAGHRIEWEVAPLPIVVADQNMMRQVWQNLLGNAVKYSGTRPVASIRVGYTLEEDGSHHFSVRDNGAGFDMQYAGKLFGVFQRLHKASDYPGTGIGLASVRRVLARHDGRIWAEAEVDQGATFHFILPSSLDAPTATNHKEFQT